MASYSCPLTAGGGLFHPCGQECLNEGWRKLKWNTLNELLMAQYNGNLWNSCLFADCSAAAAVGGFDTKIDLFVIVLDGWVGYLLSEPFSISIIHGLWTRNSSCHSSSIPLGISIRYCKLMRQKLNRTTDKLLRKIIPPLLATYHL